MTMFGIFVVDNKQVVAVFQIINAVNIYAKNLDIKFAPTNQRRKVAYCGNNCIYL